MSNFNLKEVVNNNPNHWNAFKFEIKYSNRGVARVYVNDRKTSYYAGGYGYDKESSAIATMVNDLIGAQKYSKTIYGSSCNYKTAIRKGGKGFLSGCTGFNSVAESFNYKRGCKLEKIYSGSDGDVYSIMINKKMLNA